jgi:hypothetical protein
MPERTLRLAVLAVVIGTTTAGCAGGSASTLQGVKAPIPPVIAPAGPAPGTDARIQRWFVGIDKARAAFNNVLFKAEHDIASGTTVNCAALVTATRLIGNVLPALNSISNGGPAIAAAYGPPIAQFATAAVACTNHDFATARAVLGDTSKGAIAAYGNAQNTVDEILDGGA